MSTDSEAAHEEVVELQVYFDPQTFLRQRTGGISRMFADLVAAFDSDDDMTVAAQLAFRWSNNRHIVEALPTRDLRCTPQWMPRGVMYAPWWLRPDRARGPVDLVHHTYYSERFLGVCPGVPRVTTVYDMIPELFADSGIHTGSHLQKRRYVQEADLVICISQSTCEDLERIFGRPPGMVRVIPLGVQPGFSPDHPPLPGLPHDYLLYVGARRGYKDFELLPRALADLRGRGIDIPLVVVGKPLTTEEAAQMASVGVLDRVTHASLDDTQLKSAYAHCAALVQTSSYEGFGLTPLEAMASGVPAVIADASSMPEVGGSVASYFAAGDAESLANAIETVLTDRVVNAEMRRQGIERARQFTTHRTAELTSQAYREVLSS